METLDMASDGTLYGARLDREGIALSGPVDEQADFLQSLVTNDIGPASPDDLVYAALLTPQGKYLSDFFIFRDGDGNYVLDVAAGQGEALEKRLTMYRLRRPVDLTRTPLPAAAFWGGEMPGALPDPRDSALGSRLYGEAVEVAIIMATAGDYDLHRLKLGVPESGTDLIPNDTYILEAGFERLNGVDFKKGCYIGQEIVARMKHKTDLRKQYRIVTVEGVADPDSPIVTEDGKPAGRLYSVRDGVGLALVRLERAKTAESLRTETAKILLIQSIDSNL